jgi:hypothetical protein
VLGVIANSAEERVVQEFFELFKTPWEFYRSDHHYDVVLCAGNVIPGRVSAKLVLVYAYEETSFDIERDIQVHSRWEGAEVSFPGSVFPIYGATSSFRHQGRAVLAHKETNESVAFVEQLGATLFARVGYDLFREVRTLLLTGQPSAHAATPTLEIHIAFLRRLITGCGIPLLEIPPVPDGHPFIACLTHDLDHASLRGHKFDATIFGFLYRATLGSLINWTRGRSSLAKLFTNWSAAAKLPFVYAGVAQDFWYEFDRYLEIEAGRPSTFFAIPFARHAGRSLEGSAPDRRACGYDVSQIADKIRRLKAHGCEIGLHGIDAWVETAKGREEAQRISEISGTTELGVRMHWLYKDEKTPVVLEEAQFSYDSTAGYNETVGYCAGTGQAFKPLPASRLIELPMLVMDTALFYPAYLNLTETEAWEFLTPFFDNAMRFGGAFTVNWHDRSIAPERLWGDFYVRMLNELSARGAWFCTAGQAVSWFRKRRSAVFETISDIGDELHVRVRAEEADSLPRLRLRLYRPQPELLVMSQPWATETYNDISFNGSMDTRLNVGDSRILT